MIYFEWQNLLEERKVPWEYIVFLINGNDMFQEFVPA